MARSLITDRSSDFTYAWEDISNYLKNSGTVEGGNKRFAWFRPSRITNDPNAPFTTAELDELGRELINNGDMEQGNSGDFYQLALQTDLITMLNRAYAERHRSKLQSFANASGTFAGISDPNGVMEQGVTKFLDDVARRAMSLER